MVLACSGAVSDCMDGFERDAAGNCVSSGGGVDSVGAAIDSGDSGAGDSGMDTGGAVSPGLTEHGVVSCPDPGLREAQPMELADMGADWGEQDWYYPREEVAGAGVTVAELTGDGLYDIVLSHWGEDQLFVAQPGGGYADETAARWPASPARTASVTAVDIEGDGDLDLFICAIDSADTLLINDGSGHFSDGTAAAGLDVRDRRCMGATFGDMDGDGDLDLFAADYLWCALDLEDPENYQDCVELPDGVTEPQSLWENRGDGTFADVSDRLPRSVLVESMMHSAAWLDADGDGDLDLYLVNDYRDFIPWATENRLYLNDGSGQFAAAPELNADVRVASMGLGVGDLNGDELPDLLISDEFKITLLESLGGAGWAESALARGLEVDGSIGRTAGWGTALADLDNDGDLDAPMVFGVIYADTLEESLDQPDAIYLQGDDGRFVEVGERWGFYNPGQSRSLAVLDVDGDGWLDLLRGALDGPAELYRARCGAESWLTVHLRDGPPNAYGIGAAVRVEAGGRSQIRWVMAGGTSLHTSLQPLAHFGLGASDVVDAVEVRWPDGALSRYEDIAARQEITIRR